MKDLHRGFLGVTVAALLLTPAWLAAQSTAAPATPPRKKELHFEGSKIEGQREKPKDLYILPWQGTSLADESQLQLNIFAELNVMPDRARLQREKKYYDRFGQAPYLPPP